MKFFVKHLKVNRSGVLVMLAFQAGLFLMGLLIVVVVNATVNDDRDYAAIGGMMALMATLFGGLVRGSGAMNRCRMAVSMGHTRRSYMLADPIITMLNTLVGIVFAWLLDKFELWLYGLLYPGWELELDVFAAMKWWYYPIFILAICVLDFCFGALQLRFGNKGFAAIWFPLCFAPMIIGNSVNAAREGGSSLLAQIGRGLAFLIELLSPAMWAAVGIVLVLGLLVLSVLCYRRAEVRI